MRTLDLGCIRRVDEWVTLHLLAQLGEVDALVGLLVALRGGACVRLVIEGVIESNRLAFFAVERYAHGLVPPEVVHAHHQGIPFLAQHVTHLPQLERTQHRSRKTALCDLRRGGVGVG